MKYQLRKRMVDAIQWTGDNAAEIAAFVGEPELLGDKHGGLTVRTLDGLMIAGPGDFIIKSEFGSIAVWREDVFRQCYEEVE